MLPVHLLPGAESFVCTESKYISTDIVLIMRHPSSECGHPLIHFFFITLAPRLLGASADLLFPHPVA